MSLRYSAAVALSALCVSMNTQAQCDDPYDQTLCVPTLSEIEEGQFSASDGQVSAFWNDWASRDYIEMVSPNSCYPGRCGFTGADDAMFTVKAAGTSKGLYLLTLAQDNVWVDRTTVDDWGSDCVDLYFDNLPSDDIASCTDCLIGLYSSALTFSTQQFQVWMGATQLPSGCRFAYYDANAWSWQTIGLDWMAASALYGLKVEVVQVDATHKAQEWFFPWERVGAGLPVGTALGNKRMAFSGGYNDRDGDNPEPDCLRWLTKDPWTIENGETYWGDFLLAADMGTVQAAGIGVNHRAPQASRNALRVGNHDSYTLLGQRVTASAGEGQSRVIVQRSAGQSRLVSTAR